VVPRNFVLRAGALLACPAVLVEESLQPEARPLALRVLVVDDNEAVRRVLREILTSESDIQVICEASNGSDALRLARQHQPDLALIDIGMPIMNGFEVIRLIKRELPLTQILVVSQFDSPAFLREATSLGANGYVRKYDAGRDLIQEVRRIQRGISEDLSSRTA
jgi:DNA-binding NarL/FixJ family response regulator